MIQMQSYLMYLNARQMHKKYKFGRQKSRVTKCDLRYNFNQMHQREYVSYDKCCRGHTSVNTYSYDLSTEWKKETCDREQLLLSK